MSTDPNATAAEAKDLLRDRARALARPPAEAPAAHTMIEVLEFSLAQERYALETRFVREVTPLKDLTPLPGTPPFVRGIVNVRGQILPVFDLKRFFNLPDEGLTDLHRIIFVEGNAMELGLLADATAGVRSIPTDRLQPALPTLTGIRRDFVKGVTAERLVVLDLARMLADPNIVVNQEVDHL